MARTGPGHFGGASCGTRAGRGADQGRLQHGPDRRCRGDRQAGPRRDRNLARRRERKGRAARPAGRSGVLRRSEQSIDSSRDLRQAARHRPCRPADRPLCDQHGHAGHSRDHAEEHADDRAYGECRQRPIPLPALFLDDPVGSRSEARVFDWFLRAAAEPEAADPRHHRRRCRVCPECRGRGARECAGARAQDRL